MTPLPSFVLPAILGLVAGIGHGVVSHQADLPFSLSEQLLSVVNPALQAEAESGWDVD